MFGQRGPQGPANQGGAGSTAGLPAKQTATASNTFAAAETVTVTPALPGTAVGRPKWLRLQGNVSGVASIQIGNLAVLNAVCVPNQVPDVVQIPPNAFPSPVNSVSVSLTADAAGVLRVVIGFD